MIAEVRKQFNSSFSSEKYKAFLRSLDHAHEFKIRFRVAETPVFISHAFGQQLFTAAEEITDFMVGNDLKKLTSAAIPNELKVPGETDHTLFLAFDFAVVRDKDGALIPQLIELQGFPSLYGFQDMLASQYQSHYPIPKHFEHHFGLTQEAYWKKLTKAILGNQSPENTVLLEIDPFQQNTAIDFVVTQQRTGIPIIDIANVKREGRKLFYENQGKIIPIHRIYNRVIFDELLKRPDLQLNFHLTEEVDVEWAGHPNWFYRISKYLMPFIDSRFVPECRFLHDYTSFPVDLENYVLKPLFSFSGSGVIFHLSSSDLDAIPPDERKNYVLQRKVRYEPVIQAPDGMVKVEIRLLLLWESGQLRPQLITNLARLSRGEMIGVKFNQDKTWVGGSVCFFES